VIKESVSELAARLGDADFVLKPHSPQLISIAGVIGVGKTTLTKKLSNLLGYNQVLEPYDKNPFMPEVYAGRKELALDSQLFFLSDRITQLGPKTLKAGQIAISDYIFDKERIYAGRTLNPQQLALYEKIYRLLGSTVTTPVLVIYLQDSMENCLQRIHKRNRPYEQEIELKFLEALNSDYEQLFNDWRTCPIIRISMSKFDCNRDNDIDHLANQIRYYVAI
jgi:deoxyadenosine/deoxycytidine kinase